MTGTFRDREGMSPNMKQAFIAVAALLVSIPAMARSTSEPRLVTNAFPAPMSRQLSSAIEEAAAQYQLDPNLLAAMAFKESAFNPRAVSRRGAMGILQLMPRTARYLGVHDAFDVRQNVFGGARYVRQLLDRFNGDLDLTLASYNLGPERISKEGPRATPGVIKYVGDIKHYYAYASRRM